MALTGFEFGEHTITIDCDVLQADGGTRTAAITGGAVALSDACAWLARERGVPNPFRQLVAAISVGVIDGEVCLDLAYGEDRDADVDANVVMAEPDRYVEVQGTAEGHPFDRATLDRMLAVAGEGIRQLFALQQDVLSA